MRQMMKERVLHKKPGERAWLYEISVRPLPPELPFGEEVTIIEKRLGDRL